MKGRLSKKCKNCFKHFQVLRFQAVIITPQWLQKLKTHGVSSFHFYRYNQFKVFPLGFTLRTGNYTPNKRFCDFDYILMVSITQQYWVTRHHASSNTVIKRLLYEIISQCMHCYINFATEHRFRLKLILYRKVGQFNFALLNGIIVTN